MCTGAVIAWQELQVLSLETALYVRVQELPQGPKPLPLQSGFNMETAYRALGMFNPSETSDAYFILANDRNETWFICNRHVRCVGLAPQWQDFRRPLEDFAGQNPVRQPVQPDTGPSPVPVPGQAPQMPAAQTNASGLGERACGAIGGSDRLAPPLHHPRM